MRAKPLHHILLCVEIDAEMGDRAIPGLLRERVDDRRLRTAGASPTGVDVDQDRFACGLRGLEHFVIPGLRRGERKRCRQREHCGGQERNEVAAVHGYETLLKLKSMRSREGQNSNRLIAPEFRKITDFH